LEQNQKFNDNEALRILAGGLFTIVYSQKPIGVKSEIQ
jgi:hypothetical protein